MQREPRWESLVALQGENGGFQRKVFNGKKQFTKASAPALPGFACAPREMTSVNLTTSSLLVFHRRGPSRDAGTTVYIMQIKNNVLVVTTHVLLHHQPEILERRDSDAKVTSGIVPLCPGRRKVGMSLWLRTTSPALAMKSKMYFPRELVEGIPHLTSLALKSPATTTCPVVPTTLCSKRSILSRKSWMASFGMR
ncbi:hypothetical protein J6590_070831 [Homalodisca vitripennis]|nr:hypothetical protein J6590_093658 [Homalodisca vitripennis]KAG8276179.1 hypothetical protein J6590_070831 [Homalodisca vitripennis]